MNLYRPMATEEQLTAVEIRVRGRVQGVGFRPTVWRLAREHGLCGEVLNDSDGVLVRAGGSPKAIAGFVASMQREPPPLSRIDRVEIRRRNMITPDQMPFKTGLVFIYDSGDFPAIMDKALEAADCGDAQASVTPVQRAR